MRSDASQLPLLQMRQQASSEDGEVLLGQTFKQQRRQSLAAATTSTCRGAESLVTTPPALPLSQDEAGDTGDAAVTGASACLE